MFGRMIEALAVRSYRASRRRPPLGRLLKATASGPQMYAAILIAEEILDALQRETMADETLQPLIRMVSRIHVVEEARHVRFAREELAAARSRPPGRWAWRTPGCWSVAPPTRSPTAWSIPTSYAAVGIPPAVGRAAARANPHWRATLRWSRGAGARHTWRASAWSPGRGVCCGPGPG